MRTFGAALQLKTKNFAENIGPGDVVLLCGLVLSENIKVSQ